MLSTCWQGTPSVTSLGLNDNTFRMILFLFYAATSILDPVKWHHHKLLVYYGPQSMLTNRSSLTMKIKTCGIQKSNWKVRIIWLAPSLSWVKIVDIKSFVFWGKCTFEVREDDLLLFLWRSNRTPTGAQEQHVITEHFIVEPTAWGHKIWLSVCQSRSREPCSLNSDLCYRRVAGGREGACQQGGPEPMITYYFPLQSSANAA